MEIDEIYLDWETHDYASVTLGIIENELTSEEYMPSHKRLFGAEGLITDYIDTLGYAGSSNIGVKLYKEYKKKTLPFSYLLHPFYSNSQTEVEVKAEANRLFDLADTAVSNDPSRYVSYSDFLKEKSDVLFFIDNRANRGTLPPAP